MPCKRILLLSAAILAALGAGACVAPTASISPASVPATTRVETRTAAPAPASSTPNPPAATQTAATPAARATVTLAAPGAPVLTATSGTLATRDTRSGTVTPYVESALAPLVERAKQDLAQQLKVNPAAVLVVEARSVTWANGSLGCPQPGMSYTEALVPGALIRLQVDNVVYEYHSGRTGDPIRCTPDRVQQPVGEGPNGAGPLQ